MNKFFFANSKTNKNLEKPMTITFVLLIFGILLIYFIKAVYSIPRLDDESFYLTVPHRVLLGDSLLIDEWYPAQFASFVQYPFIFLYIKITGSTDGIILFMRLVFCLFHLITGIAIYLKLKERSYCAAFFAMLIFCLFIPSSIMQLSYYNIGIICAEWIALLILATEKRGFLRCFCVGALTAVAVSAQPFNAIIYFIYTIMAFGYPLYSKHKNPSKTLDKYFNLKLWLYLTIGIASVFCVFLLYLTKTANINEIINAIPNIFTDSEHASSNLFNYEDIFFALFEFNPFSFPCFIGIFLVLIFDKKRKEHTKIWVYICSIAVVIYYITLLMAATKDVMSLFFREFPFFIFSIEMYILTKNKNKNLFVWWLFGIAYTLCLGTQAFFYVGALGCAISNTSGILMVFDFLNEFFKTKESLSLQKAKNLSENKKLQIKPLNKIDIHKISVLPLSLLLVICLDLIVGMSSMLFENEIMQNFFYLNDHEEYVEIENGPFENLYLPQTKADEYNGILQDLDYIKENYSGRLLVTQVLPWSYLYFDEPYATFSSWDTDYYWEKYQNYFETTGNYPSCIYIPYQEFIDRNCDNLDENAKEYFTELFDCTVENGKYGYILIVDELKN